METASINRGDSIVYALWVVEEIPRFKEDAKRTSYNRKYDWHLVSTYVVNNTHRIA